MQSACITGERELEVRDVPVPIPAAGQVRVRVDYVGICGSDLHYYFEGANGAFVVREPLTPGHELSGRVDHDPSGAWKPGTPVTVHPARFGTPDRRTGRHLWSGGSYLGSAATSPHTQGALSEYLVVDEPMLRALPEALPIRRAVLAEPLGVALHAIKRATGPSGDLTGARVLVTGSGPIGLLTVAAARACGAATVAATDLLAGPRARARAVGADETYDGSSQDIPAHAFDIAFECSGGTAALSSALEAVRPSGTVVLVGMMSPHAGSARLAPLVSKELSVLGSFRFDDEIDDAITLLARRPELEHVITHEVVAAGPNEIVDAFETARDSELSGKVIVAAWPSP